MLSLVLLSLELFHLVSHLVVLFGWKQLPRRVLVKQRPYFLFDLATVLTSWWVHGRWWGMVLLQNLQHAFYFITWDKSAAAKRVISWSSLEWDRNRWVQLDLVLGTAYDAFVHAASSYFLFATSSSTTEANAAAAAVAVVLSAAVFANPALAWTSKTGHIPAWIKERMKPLTEDQRQEVVALDDLARRFGGQ